MKKYIEEFVSMCQKFQKVKVKHQKSGGLLQEIQIPTWKREDINIDFVVRLPRTQKSYDYIWMVVDRFTKSSHYIPIKSTYSADDYAKIFIDEIVCRHGIPLSIISNRGAQFTSKFRRSLQQRVG